MTNIKLFQTQLAAALGNPNAFYNRPLLRDCITHRYRVALSLFVMLLSSPVLFAQNISHTPANRIGIDITTYLGDKQTFKQGDTLAFLVNLDKAAHVLMIYQDAENNLIQVIPNRYRPQDHYPAGLFIAVPSDKEPFEFTVKPPFGEEKLWAFASQDQFPELEGDELGNGLKKLKGNLQSILQRIRPVKHGAIYGEASTTIITVAK